MGAETGLQEPKEKARISTGRIQAGFTEEVAFDLDAKRKRRVFQVEVTAWTKAQRQEIIRCVWDLWVNNSFCFHIEGQGAVGGPNTGGLECQVKALALVLQAIESPPGQGLGITSDGCTSP